MHLKRLQRSRREFFPHNAFAAHHHGVSTQGDAFNKLSVVTFQGNAHVQCTLLLLDEHANSNHALADGVDVLLQRLALRPSFRLAGVCPGNTGVVRECLRASNSDISYIDADMLWQAAPGALLRNLPGSRPKAIAEMPALND